MAASLGRIRHLCMKHPVSRFLNVNLKDNHVHLCGRKGFYTCSQIWSRDVENKGKAAKISRAMKIYMENAKAYNDFMQSEIEDYELGKRHLANIMGVDPDNFTQKDIDKSIAYLLPSGLFDRSARPVFKHPYDIFPIRRAAQFGTDGRPHHYLFYTGKPMFYEILHDISAKHSELTEMQMNGNIRKTWNLTETNIIENIMETENVSETEKGNIMVSENVSEMENVSETEEENIMKTENVSETENVTETEKAEKKFNPASYEKLSLTALQTLTKETISPQLYSNYLLLMDRLLNHPLASEAEDFILKFSKKITLGSESIVRQEPKKDQSGRTYVMARGKRKTSRAKVKLYNEGQGVVTVNDQDLTYFPSIQDRNQLMFPLQVVDKVGQVDIHCQVKHGGLAGQAGAIRIALARALCNFVSDEDTEKLRFAGLLTIDPRTKERKKTSQPKARKKVPWKRR